jgi:hypothetical protein
LAAHAHAADRAQLSERPGLNDEQLAIQVGGAASRALFEYWEQQAEASGSASSQALLTKRAACCLKAMTSTPCCSA